MNQALNKYKVYVRKRLQLISDILPKIAMGDYSTMLNVPTEEDEFTELYISINYLIEDLKENLKERNQADEKIRESEERYRALFDRSLDAVYVHDFNGRFIDANPAALSMLGYDKNDINSIDFTILLSQNQIPKALEVINEIKETGFQKGVTEYKLKHRNGEYIFVETIGSLIYSHGKPSAIQGIARDITMRKKIEEELKMNEAKYKSVIEQSIQGIIIAQGFPPDIVFVNPACTKIFNRSEEELLSFSPEKISEIIHIDDRMAVLNNYRERLNGKPLKQDYEFRIIQKDEEFRWVNMYANRIQYNGQPAIQAMIIDITEHKNAEKSLKELKEKLSIMFSSISEGIAFTDLDGNIKELNNAAAQMIQTQQDEDIIGKNVLEYIPIKEREKALECMRKTIKTGQSSAIVVTLLQKNDNINEIEFNITLLKDSDTTPIGLVLIIRDITEQKRIEKEMKRRLMRYELEEGNLYLIEEQSPNISIEAFKDLLRAGYKGIIISRTPKKEYNFDLKGSYDFVWLSETKDKGSLKPKLNAIKNQIQDLHKRNVILIDRLDYLISKIGFKKTLTLIHHLREIVYFNDHIIILSIDSSTLSDKELAQIEKETKEVSSQMEKDIPIDLLEMLGFINDQNRLGIRPTYTYIGRELCMSKPTVRKRIRQLIDSGYIIDDRNGRCKIVELTQKGRSIFLK